MKTVFRTACTEPLTAPRLPAPNRRPAYTYIYSIYIYICIISRHTDRQTYRRTDRQTDRQTYGQTLQSPLTGLFDPFKGSNGVVQQPFHDLYNFISGYVSLNIFVFKQKGALLGILANYNTFIRASGRGFLGFLLCIYTYIYIYIYMVFFGCPAVVLDFLS